ncbi:replicative DNA helicase [Geobacillus phage vB_GthS_PK3.5]|nr:replicative DNA helicase [Geobacillus phage vB_GthS_PK3.5]UYL94009.1 replicative DNA helicase [Geobacillus phage vB_GthS_PK3.6]UYL94077.1 replicative DNA helicase [Geobacillus phage vB_GthS_PK5.1]
MEKLNLAIQNERQLLGCILRDPSLFEEVNLTPDHFIDLKNRELFRAMQELKEQGEVPDMVNLTMLAFSKRMNFGGADYISELHSIVLDVNAFDRYRQNILDYHTVQKAQDMVHQFLENTKEKHDAKELQTLIENITKLEAETVRKQQTFQELLASRMEYHYSTPEKGLSGVDTGFTGLNKFTDGWQPSDLIIIGARPSMGKTALVLNSILNSCKRNDTFGTFFSIEMSKGQIVDRLIAMEGRINLMKMRNPNKTFTDEEWKRYHAAVGVLEKLNMDIRDEYTVPTIRAAIRKNMKQYPDKKHVVAIDFLTLIKPIKDTGNTHKDLTEIIQDLKQTAKDLNVPIIVLAQLNRGVENRQDKRPNMSDIRESGSIEQVADLIAFLYRDDYYNKETEHKGLTEIIITKNRNGDTGTLYMKFVKETNTFYDVVFQP